MRYLAALLVAGFFLVLPPTLHAGSDDQRLDIYWVDVEGGAATLIVTPAGESVLIDSGNPGTRDPDRIVRVATGVAGLKQIDHLITTHYHRDHFGGAATLATMLPIKHVHDNGQSDEFEQPNPSYWTFPADRRSVIRPGDHINLRQSEERSSAEVSLRCLVAAKKFIEPSADTRNADACASHRPKERDGSDNANSVVMLLSFGPFRFFDGGDLTWNQEHKLVCPFNLVGEVDVYQVTHHGLDSSNNPVVLRSLKPRVAIMNNGGTKGCLPEVFANLKDTKSIKAIYQVHKNERADGSVNNVPDEFIANPRQDGCEGNYIRLSVAPDGRLYTVSIPANDHEVMYATK